MRAEIETLHSWGCDTDGALARMLQDEDFYVEMLEEFLEEPYSRDLGSALADGRTEDAFRAAHTIKGVTGNLGLTPLHSQVCSIVELLRVGSLEKAEQLYPEIEASMDRLMRLVTAG